jgi:MFS transporter, ACS family, tartrate transporter
MEELEARTIAKVTRRLVPFLMLCYFIAYLDRVNVGFAGPSMIKDLGFSQSVFGAGAGIFFIAYFFFEVPSNLALERFGASTWIARIMLSWGLISVATAFIWNEASFYGVRILLGIAEAGFFPGIIYFLTLWFPSVYRARIVSWFMFAVPISTVLGAPVSGLTLNLDGIAGLRGWQWLFVVEGIPSVLMAIAVWFYLTDRPGDAHWLEAAERRWLTDRLDAERRQRESFVQLGVLGSLRNPRVLALGLVYFGVVAPNYGITFFLPQIIKAFGGLSNVQVGLINAVPYAVGAIGMVLWGYHSDAVRERKWHAAVSAGLIAAGFLAAAFIADPYLKIAAIAVAAFGIFSVLPVFWTLPTAFLSGSAAAAGIAAINSIGNLGGYFGPQIFGVLKDVTSSDIGGLLFLAACAVVAVVVILVLGHDPRLERGAPAALPA